MDEINENPKNILCYILQYFQTWDASNWIAAASVFIAVLSCYVVWKTLSWQSEAEHDRALLAELKLILERAYSELECKTGKHTVVRPERLAWLTSARHLCSYKKLKGSLKTDLHRTLCNEHEEFWRHHFYLLLENIDNQNFFKATGTSGEEIELRSAATVLAFSTWPASLNDPISEVVFKDHVKEYDLYSPKFIHFRLYVEHNFPTIYRDSNYRLDN